VLGTGNVPDKLIVFGSKEWRQTVKLIKDGTGKDINFVVKSKDDALKLLRKPDLA